MLPVELDINSEQAVGLIYPNLLLVFLIEQLYHTAPSFSLPALCVMFENKNYWCSPIFSFVLAFTPLNAVLLPLIFIPTFKLA